MADDYISIDLKKHPEVKFASDAYEIANAKARKAKQDFDMASPSDKNYAQIVATLKSTNQAKDIALQKYKETNAAAEAAMQADAKKTKATGDVSSAKASITALQAALTKAQDAKNAGVSGAEAQVATIQAQIDKAQGKQSTAEAALGNATYEGEGTAANPFKQNGKPFSGTLGGATYKNGIITVTPTKTVSSGTAGSTTTAPVSQPISKLPVFAKVSGTNVVDINGKVIGTTDGKTFTLTSTKPTPTPTPTPKPTLTPKPTISGFDPKTQWINYLQTAFNADPSTGGPDAKSKAMIDKLFKDAQTGVYTEQTFLAALNQVPWWQSMGPSLQNFYLETHDPSKKGFLGEQLTNAKSKIQATLASLGVDLNNVDPTTGKIIDTSSTLNGIAMEAIKNNWLSDQNGINQLEHYLSTNASLMFTKGGVIQSNLDTIKNEAHLYGINLDDTLQKSIQSDLVDPTSGRDAQYWKSQMKNLAMDQYKPFAASIKDGSTLYQATYNYRTQMAGLLETAPDNITWSDLMGGVIDPTTGNARTQADFTKQVKNNPLWQYTQNAKDTYTSLGENLMKEFGFIG